MPAPLLLDLSHTSHTRSRTGIQRVSRALHRALADQAAAVCFDPYEDAWRPLELWEEINLEASDPSAGRGSHWPLIAQLRGRVRRVVRRRSLTPDASAASKGPQGVLVPEIFSAEVGGALPRLFAAANGPRVALFHDAIALQFPEFAARSTSARFPAYMTELLLFDGVAAVSEASRSSLLDYWKWLGASRTPEVIALPLGIDPPPVDPLEAGGATPVILCVGSIEGRKNHLALLDACESLWADGLRFTVRLVGLANTETGGPALKRLEQLRSSGRPLLYDGPKDDAALESAYRECAFTVYPSLAEGFGLPVAESLARGRPCLCRMDGALGEIARGGGCVDLGSAGAPEIAQAIRSLLASPSELASLASAARERQFGDWRQYASDLLAWMASLKAMHKEIGMR
jgi:glycosyltransferase involved in cell wall biosynthesis